MAFSMNTDLGQANNCSELVIRDNSTDYWTNLVIGGDAVTAAVLTIDDVEYDVFTTFSAAAVADDQTLLEYNFGGDGGIDEDYTVSDGYHQIIYTLTAGETEYEVIKETVFYCQAACCVYQKVQKIYDYYNCDECEDTFIDDALTAYGLLKSLEYHTMFGDIQKALDTLTVLEQICDLENCNCD